MLKAIGSQIRAPTVAASRIAIGFRSLSSSSILQTSKRERFVPSQGTYPKGFNVGGSATGVKKNGALDLALLTSETVCSAACVFTQNKFRAAPVQVSAKILKEISEFDDSTKGIKAIVINSGCANAVTGSGGLEDANTMVKTVDTSLGTANVGTGTLVMSTGIIGQRLQINKITDGIKSLVNQLGSTHDDWLKTAEAICTTDTFPKLVSKKFKIKEDGHEYSIAGLAKGAGMIHPNMATLLGFFVTDAPVSQEALQKILSYAVDRSFNCISVDGDTSTNDTIAALANGAKGGDVIDIGSEGYNVLQETIMGFAQDLAKLVVRDGEGATKFVEIEVVDAESYSDAKKIAASIATSALVKTALYGKDANWGRILCATGYSGGSVEPDKTSVSFVPVDGTPELKLLVNGEPENVDETRASEILESEDLKIRVEVGTGKGHQAQFWTCDFSHEYVTINGDYRS